MTPVISRSNSFFEEKETFYKNKDKNLNKKIIGAAIGLGSVGLGSSMLVKTTVLAVALGTAATPVGWALVAIGTAAVVGVALASLARYSSTSSDSFGSFYYEDLPLKEGSFIDQSPEYDDTVNIFFRRVMGDKRVTGDND